MSLPLPPAELQQALRFADFTNATSMQALELAVRAYARALRAATATPWLVASTVRALVDDSLPLRVIPIRTSEDRTRLLALAADWCAAPAP
jgi:hypothetical protein